VCVLHCHVGKINLQEEFEDTKEVIGNRKSQKDRKHNDRKKKDKKTKFRLILLSGIYSTVCCCPALQHSFPLSSATAQSAVVQRLLFTLCSTKDVVFQETLHV
jgi:hypothetical protein